MARPPILDDIPVRSQRLQVPRGSSWRVEGLFRRRGDSYFLVAMMGAEWGLPRSPTLLRQLGALLTDGSERILSARATWYEAADGNSDGGHLWQIAEPTNS